MGLYSQERRASVMRKLLPPYNGKVTQVALEEGICTATLYNWLKSARERGEAVPGSGKKTANDWSGEAKLAVVLETASLNAEQLSEYCRRKGLYAEQLERWKQACIEGAESRPKRDKESLKEMQGLRRDKKMLLKQLLRKDRALAESAALLVLQKKYQALWEDEDE